MNTGRYDAFISYSHQADSALAMVLESRLEKWAKPWYAPRIITVCRDETSLAADPDLWLSIAQKLDDSDHLILCASRSAAASKWVAKEICHWLTAGGCNDPAKFKESDIRQERADRMLLVLTDGKIEWDDANNDFHWNEATALPTVLHGVYKQEPVWVDLRWARGLDGSALARCETLNEPVLSLLSTITGKNKVALRDENDKEQKKTIRLFRGLSIGIGFGFLLAALGGWIAWQQRNAAVRERDESLRRQAYVQFQIAQSSRGYTPTGSNPIQSALDASRAARIMESVSGRSDGDSRLTADYIFAARWSAARLRFGLTHKDNVMSATYIPGARRLVTVSGDTARLWNCADGKQVGTAMKHGAPIKGLSLIEGLQRILTWSEDHTARLWRVSDGSAICTPMRHSGKVTDAQYVGADDSILTCSDDGTYSFWNAADGSLRKGPISHPGIVSAHYVADHHRLLLQDSKHEVTLRDENGKQIGVTATNKGVFNFPSYNASLGVYLTWDGKFARVWSIETGTEVTQPMEHEHDYLPPRFETRDGVVITHTRDTAWMWRVLRANRPDGMKRDAYIANRGKPLSHEGKIEGVAYIEELGAVVTWSEEPDRVFKGTAWLWSPGEGVRISAPMRHDREISNVQYLSKPGCMVTLSQDGTARLWNRDGTPRGRPMIHDGNIPNPVDFAEYSEDANLVLTSARSGAVALWDAKTAEAMGSPVHNLSWPWQVGLLRQEDGFFTLGSNVVRVWQFTDGLERLRPCRYDCALRSVECIEKCATRIVVCGQNCVILSTWTGDGWKSIKMPHLSVWGTMPLARHNRVLSWGFDGTARLWSATDGSPVGSPLKHAGNVWHAYYSEKLDRILTCSDDKSARLWSSADGSPIGGVMAHDAEVKGGFMLEDLARVLTWSADGVVKIWDLTNAAPVAGSFRHQGEVRSVVRIPSKKQVIVCSDDGKYQTTGIAQVWDISSGQPVGQPMKHDDIVWGAEYIEKYDQILTWGRDGKTQLWRASGGLPAGKPTLQEGQVKFADYIEPLDLIMTCGGDDSVRLWTLDGHPVGRPMHHEAGLQGAIFLENSRRILSWCEGGEEAKLWSTQNYECLARFAHTQYSPPALSADKATLFTIDEQTVRSYDISDLAIDATQAQAILEIRTGATLGGDGLARNLTYPDYKKMLQPNK